jgi:hypothetical protein
MTTEPSDALTVARWCWPDDDDWTSAWREQELGDEDRLQISEAERILIERGHGAAYGRALWEELRSSLPDRVRAPELKEDQWEQMAAIATAPRAVRLRAMAETIRNLKPKETDK